MDDLSVFEHAGSLHRFREGVLLILIEVLVAELVDQEVHLGVLNETRDVSVIGASSGHGDGTSKLSVNRISFGLTCRGDRDKAPSLGAVLQLVDGLLPSVESADLDHVEGVSDEVGLDAHV